MLDVLFCRWEGEGDQETGKNKDTGKVLVRVNPRFYRPTEVVSYILRIYHIKKCVEFQNICKLILCMIWCPNGWHGVY